MRDTQFLKRHGATSIFKMVFLTKANSCTMVNPFQELSWTCSTLSKKGCNKIPTKVNDIRPGADPANERIKSQLVAKHGQDFKSKVVGNNPMLFLMAPWGWIDDERITVHCLKLVCIGLYIPSDLKISRSSGMY